MIILIPTQLEAQRFCASNPHASVVICGVGAAQCAATTAHVIADMRSRGKEELLVLAGIAGSYSLEEVALCEVIEVTSEQIAALPARFAESYQVESRTSLRAVSSNSVNCSSECICNAQIENMEGAAFMAVCQRLNVDYMQIRAISNKVGDPFEMWRVDEACAALATTLNGLPGLARLGWPGSDSVGRR
ncbi:MAG: hypothetical protein R3Y44_07075 [Rikenellaceae bacterium]